MPDPIVVFFCLKGTLRKLASSQSPTLRSGHTRRTETCCIATGVDRVCLHLVHYLYME